MIVSYLIFKIVNYIYIYIFEWLLSQYKNHKNLADQQLNRLNHKPATNHNKIETNHHNGMNPDISKQSMHCLGILQLSSIHNHSDSL